MTPSICCLSKRLPCTDSPCRPAFRVMSRLPSLLSSTASHCRLVFFVTSMAERLLLPSSSQYRYGYPSREIDVSPLLSSLSQLRYSAPKGGNSVMRLLPNFTCCRRVLADRSTDSSSLLLASSRERSRRLPVSKALSRLFSTFNHLTFLLLPKSSPASWLS